MEKEFYQLIKPIIRQPNYQKMKEFRHHKCFSTYYHSLKVAYLCYKYVQRHHSKVNLPSLIRGALLHDYYLYDWHTKDNSHRLHGFRHPKFSLKNAERDYGNIDRIERDIILHHMFPLTLIPPLTKEGWIVCLCDKKATISDYKRKKCPKHNKKRLKTAS